MHARLHRATAVLALALLTACAGSGPRGATSASSIAVGPPDGGSVVVVGGGALGPEIYKRFIELAGGPDALILDIPTAGGAPQYGEATGTKANFEAAGARNVKVLHTYDRKIADNDTFVDYIKRAGGVWFDGGRQYRLVDAYGGTKSEAEFHAVLARGGVVGGSSAGASILGSYMVRGAPSNNNGIMSYPGYERGFGFMRNTGIDQHVVARYRLPDLADSLLPRFPNLLLISEDEGTAWVVQGDMAEIIGRGKAFAYNGRETDADAPFLTLWPGDRYDLAARRVTSRAADGTGLTRAGVDSLFAGTPVVRGGAAATVHVARAGKVLVNHSYNTAPQRRFTPTTSMPNFDLGAISQALNGEIVAWLASQGRLAADNALDGGATTVTQYLGGAPSPEGGRALVSLLADKGGATYPQLVQRRVRQPGGMQRTEVDSTTGVFRSNVDDLYRLSLTAFASPTAPGWRADRAFDQARYSSFATMEGRRAAFVRYPESQAVVIVLTDSDAVDAAGIANRLAAKLFARQ